MSGWGATACVENIDQLEQSCIANLDGDVFNTFKAIVNHCIFFGEKYHCAATCPNKKLFDSVMKNYTYARSTYDLESAAEAYSILGEILLQPQEKAIALVVNLINELVYKNFHHDAYLIFSAFAHRISWRDDSSNGTSI
jgi:hypothetical protein